MGIIFVVDLLERQTDDEFIIWNKFSGVLKFILWEFWILSFIIDSIIKIKK
jgi:hypothetical protein